MTLETLSREIKSLHRKIDSLIADKEQPQWVKLSTVVETTKKSREWVRMQRLANETIAIKEGGNYRYDLNKLKQLAA